MNGINTTPVKPNPPIRKGDRVRIVTPEMFVRCGYPKSLDEAIYEFELAHGEELQEFLRSLGHGKFSNMRMEGDVLTRLYKKVRRELAHAQLKKEHYGGCLRSIHTKHEERWKDKEMLVTGVRFVVTGYYERGGWIGGLGEEEYEPPCLGDQKRHKILRLGYGFENVEIEDIHVEKIGHKSI